MAETTTNPVGQFGYIGYGLVFGYPVRGASFNLKATQQVFNGEPASNEPEQPVYHLGPLMVDGQVSFPLIFGDPVFWKLAQMTLKKVVSGRKKTLEAGDITLFYPPARNNPSYFRTFTGCAISNLNVRASGGERIETTLSVMGIGIDEGSGGDSSQVPSALSRVLTWNDVAIDGEAFEGCSVKEFSFDINNNVSRVNTYCYPLVNLGTGITATALITGRREVAGSLTFMGPARSQFAAQMAMVSDTPFEGYDELTISMGSFTTEFHRVVWELQQIDLNSGIIYGRAGFSAHGGGPGEPSIEFKQSAEGEAATTQALKALDQQMSQR